MGSRFTFPVQSILPGFLGCFKRIALKLGFPLVLKHSLMSSSKSHCDRSSAKEGFGD